jgi:hypothetical protein
MERIGPMRRVGQLPLTFWISCEVPARAARNQVLPRMARETESLIGELLPAWRSSVA